MDWSESSITSGVAPRRRRTRRTRVVTFGQVSSQLRSESSPQSMNRVTDEPLVHLRADGGGSLLGWPGADAVVARPSEPGAEL